jgi:hypothetical protein
MPGLVRSTLAVVSAVSLLVACGNSTAPQGGSVASSTQSASPTAGAAVQATPVIASVIAAPVPVPTTDGKVHLAYELQLTNVLGGDITLKSLSVKAAGKQLLSLDGKGLAYWTRALGAGTVPTDVLHPGQAGIVWLDVVLDGAAPVPTELTHTFVVALAEPTPPLLPAVMTEDDIAPVAVSEHRPAVISPPLDGPRWLDGNSCCDMTAHRMAMNPLNGNIWAAERFAIDYVQLSTDGTIFTGDRAKPESYPYFGANIHAVADGPVVAVLDGLPEQVAGQSPTGLPLEQYAGNHVVQDIGGGNYALYAHLEDRHHQGSTGRPTHRRPGDRQPRQHRQHRRTASTLPRDEHTGSVAFQRIALRLEELHPGGQGGLDGCPRSTPGGEARGAGTGS